MSTNDLFTGDLLAQIQGSKIQTDNGDLPAEEGKNNETAEIEDSLDGNEDSHHGSKLKKYAEQNP